MKKNQFDRVIDLKLCRQIKNVDHNFPLIENFPLGKHFCTCCIMAILLKDRVRVKLNSLCQDVITKKC